jgi:modification methylase
MIFLVAVCITSDTLIILKRGKTADIHVGPDAKMGQRARDANSALIVSQPDWPVADSAAEEAALATEGDHRMAGYVPPEIGPIGRDHQTALPRIAKDARLTHLIDQALRRIPTHHEIYPGDARHMDFLQLESVHLIACSPPYWTLKEYREAVGQLGHVPDYEHFLAELDRVWAHCYRALVPGGRLIIVVGDVCLSRRKNKGRHTVVPLHASIQEHCRKLGFDNLQGIFWHKIANAAYEVENGSGFLGKPYEPNAVIKNDVEYILMQRKPGGYRSPSVATRVMSVISEQNYQKWFRLVWDDLPGASTKDHPAPYPVELAERLIRMFSFAGDTVLDPFLGTGSTSVAAARCGRNSIGVEIDPHYRKMASDRLARETQGLFSKVTIQLHGE